MAELRLTIRELQMIAAALLRHEDNVPQESLPIIRSAHQKIIQKLRTAQ